MASLLARSGGGLTAGRHLPQQAASVCAPQPIRQPQRRIRLQRCAAAAWDAPPSPAPLPAGATALPPPAQRDAAQLAALMQQLSSLGVRPHDQWLDETLSQIKAAAPQLAPEDITEVFKALAAWGFTPRDALLDALEQHCVQGAGARAFSARQLAMLAWSYAQLGLKQRPLLGVIMAAAEEEFRSPSVAGACPPEAMADLIWAAARLQHAPVDEAWLSAFYAATQPRLRDFAPQHASRTLWALARLRAVPPADWLQDFQAASQANLRGLDIKSMSLMLWALATLCSLGAAKPSHGWLDAFEAHAEAGARQLGAAEAATSLWALGQLTGQPPQQLRLAAALRKPAPQLSRLDFELLADIRMLRVVRSLITGTSAAAP